MSRPLVVAHRSKTADSAIENSLRAVQLAAEAGADLVELDIRLSLDRRAVVVHDAFLGRTTTGHGWVRLYPSVLLRRLRLRTPGGGHVPLLRDLLPAIPPAVQPALHLKEPALDAVLRDIDRAGTPARTWLWLDRLDDVRRSVTTFPSIKCTYLPTEARTPPELSAIFPAVRDAGAVAVGVDADQVVAQLVDNASAHGLRLFAMLYDSQWSFLDHILSAGIGGVITDNPARVRSAIPPP